MAKKDHAKNFQYLVGKKIKNVRYMDDEEMEDMGWYCKPLIIEFEDASFIFPMQDDEGNDGGAMAYGSYTDEEAQDTIYVIR